MEATCNSTTNEKPHLLKRHKSLLDFKQNSKMNLNTSRRRVSFDITKLKGLSISEDQPKQTETDSNFKGDDTQTKLPELACIPPISAQQTQRRYTVISAPVQLHTPRLKPIKKQRSQPNMGSNFTPLPSIRSSSDLKTCENIVGKEDGQTIAGDLEHSGAFVPKPCWCMRCQIMLAMFQTGDKQLEIWGNYPCFRR